MLAYFIHNTETVEDVILVPDIGCSSAVTPDKMKEFVAPNPDFAKWVTDACNYLDPESFGTVVATRQANEDVCILKEEIWRERLLHYLD